MSHFTVLVILPKPANLDDVNGEVASLIARYDENKETPQYVKRTKAEVIAYGRKEIEEYAASSYAKFLSDPAGYEASCQNPQHMIYIRDEFPVKLTWTDEQVYTDHMEWMEPGDIGPSGEELSTYNPDSKWDWWCVGGRWTGELFQGGEDVAPLTSLAPGWTVYAIVTPKGEWIGKGRTGWFGASFDEDAAWKGKMYEIASAFPDHTGVLIDCHI